MTILLLCIKFNIELIFSWWQMRKDYSSILLPVGDAVYCGTNYEQPTQVGTSQFHVYNLWAVQNMSLS